MHLEECILTVCLLLILSAPQNDNTNSRPIFLSKKLHNQSRYRPCDKRSPKNIGDSNKPGPISHKDMIREIIGAVGKESEESTAEKYF